LIGELRAMQRLSDAVSVDQPITVDNLAGIALTARKTFP
jgi:hypothetical protein